MNAWYKQGIKETLGFGGTLLVSVCVFVVFIGLLLYFVLKNEPEPKNNTIVMCMIDGEPSAIVRDLRQAWVNGEGVKTLAPDGTVTQYKMHNGEICYITTTEPR